MLCNIYVGMHSYLHNHPHLHTHTHIHIYTHTHMPVIMRVYERARLFECVMVNTFIYMFPCRMCAAIYLLFVCRNKLEKERETSNGNNIHMSKYPCTHIIFFLFLFFYTATWNTFRRKIDWGIKMASAITNTATTTSALMMITFLLLLLLMMRVIKRTMMMMMIMIFTIVDVGKQ